MTDCSKSTTGCAMCGNCCENIWLKFSPQERNSHERVWNEDGWKSVNFVNEFWTHTGPDPSSNGHRYECAKFDKETRLCTAHDDRPPVCSGYPYYANDTILGKDIPLDCSYQADLRTKLPIVEITGA